MTEDALRHLFSTAAGSDPGAPDASHLMGLGHRHRRRRNRRLLSLGTVTAVALGIALPLELPSGGASRGGQHALKLAGDLKAFASCDSLLAELKDRARPTVGAYGYDNGAQGYATVGPVLGPAAGPDRQLTQSAPLAAPASSASSADVPLAHSSTTDRTRGVDEPDLLKSDGRHVFVLQNGRLSIYDATKPALVGSVTLGSEDGSAQQMLLEGDQVIVLGGQPAVRRSNARHDTSILTVVDVTSAEHPAVSRILTVDGDVIDSRLQSGETRLVLDLAPPQLAWFQATGNAASQTEATDSNRRLLDATTIDDWLPTYGLTDASGRSLAHGRLLDCARVTEPTAAGTNGTDLVGVVTLDPGATQGPQGALAVIGAGSTVYASGNHLWLATGNEGGWGEPYCFECFRRTAPSSAQTQLHGFDFTDPTHPTYLASASLPGTLHDDSAIDETSDGTLRVVTTQADGTHLDVLTRDGQAMKTVGSLAGIGPGEQVQSVRWLGDLAYVVTFRQTDPLHVIDLSDRAKPRLRGVLKLPGYSSYLFSPEKGRLVGVGPGGKYGRSTLVKLFDIGDPDTPAELSDVDLGGYRLDASTHALLFWRAARLLFLPIQTSGHRVVTVTRVDPNGLTATYSLTHDQRAGGGDTSVERVAVVGPRIWSVSARGVLVSTLAAGADVRWLPYR